MNEPSKAKIVGFITIILILGLLTFIALKLVSINQKEQKENAMYVSYKQSDITMKLKSDYIEYVSLGKSYEEKGVIAFNSGKNVTSDVNISYFKNDNQTYAIDTSSIGNYLVQYTYIDMKKNKSKSIYKTVIVVDKQKPIIKFPKTTIIAKDKVKDFDLTKDVKVKDNSGNADLTYENTLKNEEGSYIITYTATDPSGNKTIKKRIIKVS